MSLDNEDVEKINEGMKHCVLLTGSAVKLQCLKCKKIGDYSRVGGYPIDIALGIMWGFSREHSSCGKRCGSCGHFEKTGYDKDKKRDFGDCKVFKESVFADDGCDDEFEEFDRGQ